VSIRRDPKKSKAFNPSDFNPYEVKRKTGIPIRARDLGILKQVFVDNAGRRNMSRLAEEGQDAASE
jgi:hypothetical protein